MDRIIKFELLEEFIKKNKLTVKAFCKLCNISTGVYYRLKQDKDVHLPKLERIAKATGIKIYLLFN